MQKNDEKELTTIPHQVHLFNTSYISEALGREIVSISDIRAKVDGSSRFADVSALCKSEYSSLLTVTKEENIMCIKVKEGQSIAHILCETNGQKCKVIALTKPNNAAITF